jgi:hypothetical protein
VDEAVRAQFGDAFRAFKTLRIRRNELEYPDHPDEVAEPAEASEAIAESRRVIDAATLFLPYLGLF